MEDVKQGIGQKTLLKSNLISYSRRALREQCGRVAKSSREYAEAPIASRSTPGKRRDAFFPHSFPKVSEFTNAYGQQIELEIH